MCEVNRVVVLLRCPRCEVASLLSVDCKLVCSRMAVVCVVVVSGT